LEKKTTVTEPRWKVGVRGVGCWAGVRGFGVAELQVRGRSSEKRKTEGSRGTTEGGGPRPGGDYTEGWRGEVRRGCGRRPRGSEYKSRANEIGGGTGEWTVGEGGEDDLRGETYEFSSEEQEGYGARSQLLRSWRDEGAGRRRNGEEAERPGVGRDGEGPSRIWAEAEMDRPG
jgi:hypothetical protein